MPAPGQTDDILAALYAYGGGAPGQADPSGGLPVSGPLSTPTPTQLPSLAPSPQDPYAGPDQTQANALINPTTGAPEPIRLPPTMTPGSAASYPGSNGPDTMSKGEVPQNPYGPAPKPAKPLGAVDQATADETQALNGVGASHTASLQAQNTAKAAGLEREAQATIQGVDAKQREANAYMAAQKANDAAADQETAQWMQERDKLAKEEPNPHRYWDNTSSFGKALWLLSFAFGAKAQSKGAVQNAAIAMFDQEVNADLVRQRDRIGRELEANKDKGALLEKKHIRNAQRIQDLHGMKVDMLNSLQQALQLRAQKPGSEDDKAAIAAGLDYVNQKKVEVAADKLKYVREAKQKELDRAAENWRTQQRIAQEDRKLAEETRNHDLENNAKYDLAEEKLAAKLAAQTGKQDEIHKDLRPIPMQANIMVKHADGKVEPLQINKEQLQKATEDVQNFQSKAVGLAALRDAIKANGGWEQTLLNNNNDIRQALNSLADPMVRQMGGRLGPANAKIAADMVLGEDQASLIGRVKGASDDEIEELINKQIGDLPGAAKAKISGYSSNLVDDPKAELLFGTPDTRAPAAPKPTADQSTEAATGQAPAHVHLKTVEDADKYGHEVLPNLPPALRTTVEETITALHGLGPDQIDAAASKQGYARTMAYAKDHPKDAKEVEDAETLVRSATDKARAEAQDGLDRLKSLLEINHTTDLDKAREMATKVGVGRIPSTELVDLMKAVDDKLKSSPGGAFRK